MSTYSLRPVAPQPRRRFSLSRWFSAMSAALFTPDKADEPVRLVVVCTANICRSPMAMGLLLARLAQEGLSAHVEVRSRGVQALRGYPAAPTSAQIMAERGIDLSGHVASMLTTEDVETADLLLVMEERHRELILRYWPAAEGRVILWRELAGEALDVPDPYVYGRPEYEQALEIMEHALGVGWPSLRRLLGPEHAPAPTADLAPRAAADPALAPTADPAPDDAPPHLPGAETDPPAPPAVG